MRFRHEPFAHQLRVWGQTWRLPNFAVFWEQGTGKSKLTIDTAAALFEAGEIGALLVVAPDGVHDNWVLDELPTHMPDGLPWAGAAFHSSRASTLRQQREFQSLLSYDGLICVAITYDGAQTDAGKRLMWDVLRTRPTLMVLDESSRIQTPSAKRTLTLTKAGRYAKFRRILDGTPVSESPFNIFAQLRFLDPDFWAGEGIQTFTAFKSEFAYILKMQESRDGGFAPISDDNPLRRGARQFEKVAEYKDLDRLHAIIDRVSSRVLKEDVLDLPEKLYQMRYFEMSREQARLYESLKRDAIAWPEDQEDVIDSLSEQSESEWDTGVPKVVTVTSAITRLLRLQQVTCGYVQPDLADMEDIPGPNPRLECLREVADDVGHSRGHIVWARFQRDIDKISKALRDDGFRVVTYDGRTSAADRDRAKRSFQDGSAHKFVANPAAAGTGLTLTAAKRVTYYNNAFSLRQRLQSEDRAHRIGQTDSVLYDDITCPGTVDEHVVRTLRKKLDVSSQVTGDRLKEWLL